MTILYAARQLTADSMGAYRVSTDKTRLTSAATILSREEDEEANQE